MRQFISSEDHSGDQKDNYNKIQEANFRDELRREANFILEEQNSGNYAITKKPEDSDAPEAVTNPFEFANDHSRVLIERLNGTYDRYNFDFESQFPAE